MNNTNKEFTKPTLYKKYSWALDAVDGMHFTSDLVLQIDNSAVRGEGYYIGIYTTRGLFIQYL